MIEEKDLSLKGSVDNDDKIRVVTSAGLSQSIKVGNLKTSLSVADLPVRVSTLETRTNSNDSALITISNDIETLKSTVGEKAVEGGTIIDSGLFKEISKVRTDLATLHLDEVERLDGELGEIYGRLTLIDAKDGQLDQIAGTDGRLAVLEGNVGRLVSTKLDQSAFQNAVDAGFKMIRKTPASASAEGEPGEVCWDDTHVYVCVATDTWKRIPLESESW